MKRKDPTAYWHYFNHFFLFNLVFLGLQFAYILSLGSSFLHAIPLPFQVYFEMALTGGLQVALHALLALLQAFWLLAILAGKRLEDNHRLLMLLYALTILWVLCLNCYFFPLSEFSRLFLPPIPLTLIRWLLLALSAFFLLLTLLGLARLIRKQPRMAAALLTTGLAFSLFIILPEHEAVAEGPASTRPNIIIIGVDSFSAERLNATETPTLFHFINQSVHFTDTISPLARTYPAWSSILTGLYPIHHQARENLTPAQLVKSSASIVWPLRQAGYYTLFATDDRRFNTLDKEFGFQEIIGPKTGINDALIGTFNDFPLSNLLVNFKLSRWLFPYNHLNRASHYTYYPATFDKALAERIEAAQTRQPIFLAVHFTLPHWPYAWAQSLPAEVGDEYSVMERGSLYHAAVRQTDEQIGRLFAQLQKGGYLKNSLVIVLSDHGEALYEEGSRKTSLEGYQGKKPSLLASYFSRKTSTELQRSAGHGSDLLSPSQYTCLLGMKITKDNRPLTPAKTISTRVALIDLAPTIAAFVGLPEKLKTDGLSLLPSLLSSSEPPANRVFMLESGMLPNQFISREKARLYGILLFRVNPENGLLELREDKLEHINAMKIYGVIQGDWLLALYPDDRFYIPVLLRLSNGQWTDSLQTPFANASPAQSLLRQLLQFYADDLSTYPETKPSLPLP
ncbi:DUF229 domain-containing protein [Legionella taurinensis]|uniref:DUF229 domain-containing protein n=1 Tax=Legionella taurinensis TaxID=70611 RepID=A0A3A5L927_9GAMM|nr:sulfatase-like hydrolase/transferase [Legionella taurinensis]MDX1838524.1 sulfatase-like hydrolase/transferase [Legionella taurinensis]PUT38965.1 sulfatase [Legionella taurinensis]PUT41026.1 sulfatase [Legionella taurinensis]PUT43258.1 sulfatase [Legionella taurinensis]PUT46444.1 sulfatase [Legionella taurinensis]